jgi:hypothetical protein
MAESITPAKLNRATNLTSWLYGVGPIPTAATWEIERAMTTAVTRTDRMSFRIYVFLLLSDGWSVV